MSRSKWQIRHIPLPFDAISRRAHTGQSAASRSSLTRAATASAETRPLTRSPRMSARRLQHRGCPRTRPRRLPGWRREMPALLAADFVLETVLPSSRATATAPRRPCSRSSLSSSVDHGRQDAGVSGTKAVYSESLRAQASRGQSVLGLYSRHAPTPPKWAETGRRSTTDEGTFCLQTADIRRHAPIWYDGLSGSGGSYRRSSCRLR